MLLKRFKKDLLVGQFHLHVELNEQEGMSPSKLSSPAMCVVSSGAAWHARWRTAKARMRRPAIVDRLDASFVAHATAGVLSQNRATVW